MSKEVAHHIHESPAGMTIPLVVLAVLTVVAGLAFGIPSSTGTPFARFLAPVLPLEEARARRGHRVRAPAALGARRHRGGLRWPGYVYGRAPVRRRLDRRAAQPAPQAAAREVLRGRDLRRALRAPDLPPLALAGPRLRSRASSTGSSTGSATAVLALGARPPPGADRLRDELRARHAAGRGGRGRLPPGPPRSRHGLPALARHLPARGGRGRSSCCCPAARST